MFIGDKDRNLHNVDMYATELSQMRTPPPHIGPPPSIPSMSFQDQLPSVEEYKSQVASSRSNNSTALVNQRKVVLGIALSIVAAVIFISVGVVIGSEEAMAQQQRHAPVVQAPPEAQADNGNTVPSYSGGDNEPYSGDGNEPSTPTYNNDDNSHDLSARANQLRLFVTQQAWSDAVAVNEYGSPQNKAVIWLADNDPMGVPISDTPLLKERYALACFYFSLNGHGWSYKLFWLSGRDVCEWHDMFATSDDPLAKTYQVGVNCENGERVKSLSMPSLTLEGSVPPEISLLTELVELNLRENEVNGIPSELGTLKTLTSLSIQEAQLEGPLPHWIGELSNLKKLELGFNLFTGTIPIQFGLLTNLELCDFRKNRLDGSLEALQDLPRLEALFLSSNDLTGSLTDDLLHSWPMLKALDLGNNFLHGALPDSIFSVDSIYLLDLHANYFNGTLPSLVSFENKLEYLALQENKLAGPIKAESLMAMNNLEHLDLSANHFTGTFPEIVLGMSKLKHLSLAFLSELDSGTIPNELGNLQGLFDLSLQSSNRIGEIPSSLGNLLRLEVLDLAKNSLTGYVPAGLGDLVELTSLYLKGNQLSGIIPDTFGQLTSLQKIVIDDNILGGNADVICQGAAVPFINNFIVDCNVVCDCCTECCDPVNGTCSHRVWYDKTDRMGPYLKEQDFYELESFDILYPVQDNDPGSPGEPGYQP